jgi:hypothetical protein
VLAAAADYVHSGARTVANTAHQYTDADDGKSVSVTRKGPTPSSYITVQRSRNGSKLAVQLQHIDS